MAVMYPKLGGCLGVTAKLGKFNLSYIWDRVLLNTNGLTLKEFNVFVLLAL